jgi:hypothetical protein
VASVAGSSSEKRRSRRSAYPLDEAVIAITAIPARVKRSYA